MTLVSAGTYYSGIPIYLAFLISVVRSRVGSISSSVVLKKKYNSVQRRSLTLSFKMWLLVFVQLLVLAFASGNLSPACESTSSFNVFLFYFQEILRHL